MNFYPPVMPKVKTIEFLSLGMFDSFSIYKHDEAKIKVPRATDGRVPQTSGQCPHVDRLSNFKHKAWVHQGKICIAHTFVRRTVLKWRAKNDLRRTLSVLTSSLLQEFQVLALLESARVVLGSSKLPLEFCGANPKPSSGTRFESMSMQTLIV